MSSFTTYSPEKVKDKAEDYVCDISLGSDDLTQEEMTGTAQGNPDDPETSIISDLMLEVLNDPPNYKPDDLLQEVSGTLGEHVSDTFYETDDQLSQGDQEDPGDHPDHENPIPIGDLVLDVFVKKKPFRHIDNDPEDIITKEESIERIYRLTFILTFLLAFIASCLTTTVFIEKALGTPGRVILPNVSVIADNVLRIPGVLLVYHDGTVVKLALKRNEMVASHFASLPKVKEAGSAEVDFLDVYFGYSLSPSQETFIFDADRVRDTKLLDHNGKMKTLARTKLEIPELHEERYVRVGDLVWLFGGLDFDHKEKQMYDSFQFDIDHLDDKHCFGVVCQGFDYQGITDEQLFPKQSRLWSTKRQKWLNADGPSLTPFNATLVVNEACAVGLNATSVILIGGQVIYESPYKVHLYRFDQNKWFELSDVPLVDFSSDYDSNIFCTPLFSKSNDLSIITVADQELKELQVLLQYYVSTDTWQILETPNVPIHLRYTTSIGPMITIFNTIYLFPVMYPQFPKDVPIAYTLNQNLEWIAIMHENISSLHFKDKCWASKYITPILI